MADFTVRHTRQMLEKLDRELKAGGPIEVDRYARVFHDMLEALRRYATRFEPGHPLEST